MKNIIYLILFAITSAFVGLAPASGQTNKEAGDRIKTKRIAFFTYKLQLTPDEAQKFWPVFNEYDQKKNTITLEKRKLTETFQNNAKISDTETDKIINSFIRLSKQETQLIEDYNRKFRTILSAQKVMKLYLAETEFKIVLLRELKANMK